MEQLLINLAAGALGGIGAGIFRSAQGPARSERWVALGSASQIALFVGPVLVLLSYAIGPTPMDLQSWPGAAVMVFVTTLVAASNTSAGRSAWFVGVLLLFVYAVFAVTLYLWLPPVQ